MSNNENLPTNKEVLKFMESNCDKLSLSYQFLTPYKATNHSARISYNKDGDMISDLGIFYKPISILLDDTE